MTEIHIPDEVVEAVARRRAVKHCEEYDSDPEKTWPHFRDEVRAAILAALEAWPKTGMAREAYISDDGTHWNADTAYTHANVKPSDHLIKAIIIRTEAT